MSNATQATVYDVAVAFLVAVNTAITAWAAWQSLIQRSRIERKVDDAKGVATELHNEKGSDAPE